MGIGLVVGPSLVVSLTYIVQSLQFLNPKFQACGHLLWFYNPVCVQPGRKPRGQVFSHLGSTVNFLGYGTREGRTCANCYLSKRFVFLSILAKLLSLHISLKHSHMYGRPRECLNQMPWPISGTKRKGTPFQKKE